MKVAVLIFMALAVSVILTQANPAAAGTYSFSQLDKGMVSDDLYPAINNQGQIVWYHHGCQFEIGNPPDTSWYIEEGKYYFYQGGSLTPLNIHTNYAYPWNYFHAPLPLLNDRGQIGYVIQDYNDGGYKIYFNDGPGSSPQLASGSFPMKWDLQLNQQGQMVWYCSDANSIAQVYLFNNGQGQGSPITSYTSSAGLVGFFSGLSLNDAGQVVWIDRTYDATSTLVHNIQLYQSGVTTRIYSTYNQIFYTKINKQGQVVWSERAGVQSNIMLYDNGSANPIAGGDGVLDAQNVPFLQINNKGQVMWLGKTTANSEYNIYLYSNGSTTQVTNYTNNGTGVGIIDVFENNSDERTKFAPYLNNNGEIVWVTKVPNSSNPTYYDLAVQVYSGGQVTQLDRWTYNWSMASTWTQDTMYPAYAQINDAGQVTWCRYNGAPDVADRNSDFEIYLATPVTLANAIKSLQVLTGMMNVPGAGDVTGDKKIGLEDVIYSLQSVSGLRP